MMPYNAYRISEARRQYMLEGDNRERLADIAKAGNEKPSRMGKIMNVLHHALHRSTPDEQQTAPVSEIVPSATNG
jgi:uncharacterized protein YqeY